MEGSQMEVFIFLFFGLIITMGYGATDPNDLKVLNDFRKGLENPELLKWPENGDDPCGPPSWPYVFCSEDRVTQIQAKNLGLRGSLPPNFNQLSELNNIGLQRNNLSGMLPTLSGLSKLEFAYLDYNTFDAIPSDFFNGLSSLRVLSLEENPLNASDGWSFPMDLERSVQLTNLSLVHCNLVGTLPDFLGTLPSLTNLRLSINRLSGAIPASFAQSSIQVLWLNNQEGGGFTGPIDVIASMNLLSQLWLHGNQFTGTIPHSIGNLTSLKELNLNGNQLVGLIPESLAQMDLDMLVLNNNRLMGPIPEFKAANVSCDNNLFCQSKAGLECAPQVTALLDFLDHLNYPLFLISDWSGNEPCTGPWFGLSCNSNQEVSIINLPRHKINGTLSSSVAKLDSLLEIRLAGNNITGTVPSNFTELKSLSVLDLSDNNLQPPLPAFHDGVKILTVGNPLLGNHSGGSPVPIISPPPENSQPSSNNRPPSSHKPPVPGQSSGSNQSKPNDFKRYKTVTLVAGVAVFAVAIPLVVYLFISCSKKKNAPLDAPGSIVVHPRDPSERDNVVKISVSNNTPGTLSTKTGTSSVNISGESQNSHVIEAGNLIISVQVLRKVTKEFSPENELGRGGFGTVYKGELENGTKLAVKRMEHGAISSKALEEFQAEIAVLSKVRHRHLVSLLGYSIEGSERLLVYEYMPLGALSQHLFHWKSLNLEPLSLSQRLTIALDVARGMEYLHGLARETFIHRDLKSSNILLGDDFRAKVSDFGLVKLAPNGEKSVVTKLAGTFGYLAPEYAVMGKITTKVDVFSYGVVLMELLTGLMALDESRSEESRYLAEWFWRIKSSKEKLMAAIDPALEATEETFESTITIVAELAGHCTAREANHRPDMSHAVNVLAALVEKWRPVDDELECYSGIDYSRPLPQMLKIWKEAESKEFSYAASIEDSRGSIAARPAGFADSFTSADAR